MRKSLFISRDIDESSVFLQLEIDVFAASRISIEINSSTIDLSDFQWVFFSSKNSVKWAIQNKLDLSKLKIAALGSPTSDFANSAFGHCDFKGQDDMSTASISSEFDSVVEPNEKVLFPLSSKSKRNILKNFEKNYSEIEAYKVDHDPILFDVGFDYLIFTSPSNFLSFYSANSIKPEATIIAIGETTKSEIQKYLNIPIFTPEEKTEKAIYELLKKLIMDSNSYN